MKDEQTTPEEVEVEETTNEEVEPSTEPTEEEPEVEEQASEEVESEPEEIDEPVDEEPEPEKPSRRESLRIQQVLEKLKQQQQPAPTPPPAPQTGLDYNEALDADPETIQQLEADRQAYAQAQYQQGLAQAQTQAESNIFHTRLEIDAPKVEQKYPQLNKESSEFNPVLADAVNNWYLATAGYDPSTNTVTNANVRYSEFIDGIMELGNEIAGEKVAKTSKNIAKQAASTGLRPDGSSAKRLNLNKAPEDMTTEELEAVIKQTLPKK